jgi:hypothetical protein
MMNAIPPRSPVHVAGVVTEAASLTRTLELALIGLGARPETAGGHDACLGLVYQIMDSLEALDAWAHGRPPRWNLDPIEDFFGDLRETLDTGREGGSNV